MQKNVLLSWSGGKDSVMSLYEISTNPRYREYRVSDLVTTLTEGYDRISGHGVRRDVLERQAASLGLDVREAYISKKATMDEYESVMEEVYVEHKESGTNIVAFGDIFLKKVKNRRVDSLEKIGMKYFSPLWQREPRDLMKTFMKLGFKAFTVCVDSEVLDESFVGRAIDEDFLNQLPAEVDPCGENGEFHTFVVDGPMFEEPVSCKLGEVVLRESFYFCDLVLDK